MVSRQRFTVQLTEWTDQQLSIMVHWDAILTPVASSIGWGRLKLDSGKGGSLDPFHKLVYALFRKISNSAQCGRFALIL